MPGSGVHRKFRAVRPAGLTALQQYAPLPDVEQGPVELPGNPPDPLGHPLQDELLRGQARGWPRTAACRELGEITAGIA